jgi:putative ABC transport system substrate-binding protein
MKRRDFITSVGTWALWPLIDAQAQEAQQVYRVGYVNISSPISELNGPVPQHPLARAFVLGLRDLGYVEGRNLHIEWRSAAGKWENLPAIMQQLVADKVDVIVAPSNKATEAAKAVTQTVPIVMIGTVSPVQLGFVQSLARPGFNVTGLSYDATDREIVSKRIEILRELLPGVTRLAWLTSGESDDYWRKFFPNISRKLGFDLLVADHTPTEYRDAFALITREQVGAIYVASGGDNYANCHLIAEFAARNHIPAIYVAKAFMGAEGLMSYGPDLADLSRRGTVYVDRILRGAKPADLAVELPTKFELVINLKAAKALGLTVPPSLLVRADEVIE